jgi:hypothetical protein
MYFIRMRSLSGPARCFRCIRFDDHLPSDSVCCRRSGRESCGLAGTARLLLYRARNASNRIDKGSRLHPRKKPPAVSSQIQMTMLTVDDQKLVTPRGFPLFASANPSAIATHTITVI